MMWKITGKMLTFYLRPLKGFTLDNIIINTNFEASKNDRSGKLLLLKLLFA